MSSKPSSRPADAGRILRVEPGAVDPAVVERAAFVLTRGGIVAMRTDTVYGLLASVNRRDALGRLVDLKGRPADKPFALLAADWIGVRSLTTYLPPVARALGSRFWPGPLTLILPADDSLPEEVTASGKTVAVRVPGNDLLRAIIAAARAPLAAPSANRAGEEPAATAKQVLETFGNRIDLVLDGGAADGALPSTIVRCTGKDAKVMREGSVSLAADDLVTH